MQRSLRRLSGHGDLFPTSKAAAHLDIPWIMSRPVPPAPPAGQRYARFSMTAPTSKYQIHLPNCHGTHVVPILAGHSTSSSHDDHHDHHDHHDSHHGGSNHHDHHDEAHGHDSHGHHGHSPVYTGPKHTPAGLSDRAVEALRAGARVALGHHDKHAEVNGVAAANRRCKEEGERHAQRVGPVEREELKERQAQSNKEFQTKYQCHQYVDLTEANNFLDRRTSELSTRQVNVNPNGYTYEAVPWATPRDIVPPTPPKKAA